ncbi:hypothetical protein H4S03_006239 [Coemansia sp. S3946]|nr:hypothetical protein H4S03_006239 [Coemansia sp. S3946]
MMMNMKPDSDTKLPQLTSVAAYDYFKQNGTGYIVYTNNMDADRGICALFDKINKVIKYDDDDEEDDFETIDAYRVAASMS